MSDLILEIKEMIISGLNLEDMSVSDIDENAPLFGEGLGLDSVDALELGLLIQKQENLQFRVVAICTTIQSQPLHRGEMCALSLSTSSSRPG